MGKPRHEVRQEQEKALAQGRSRDKQIVDRIFEEQKLAVEGLRARLAQRGLSVGKIEPHRETTENRLWVTVRVSGAKATEDEAFAMGADIAADGRWVFNWPCKAPPGAAAEEE